MIFNNKIAILLTTLLAHSSSNSIRRYDPYTTSLHSYADSYKSINNFERVGESNYDNVLSSETDLRNFDTAEEADLLFPKDYQFLPRRNDRIEKLELNYRYPKALEDAQNTTEDTSELKTKPDEIVIFIETTKPPQAKTTSAKPKKVSQKRKPVRSETKISTKNNQIMDNDDVVQDDGGSNLSIPHRPHNNNMAGQSQIGNRESQMVIKPTVIVNFRGSVSNKDSEIRLEGRNNEDNSTVPSIPQNIFNINQEVNIERTYALIDDQEEEDFMKKAGQKKVKDESKNQFKDLDLNPDSRERKSLKERMKISFGVNNSDQDQIVSFLLK